MPQRLEEYYGQIEAMMAEGEALVAARDPATARLVKRRIADSALLIASYQMFVHREVFAPLHNDGDASQRARINEIKVECIALTEDLRFNIKDFLANDAPFDWGATAARMSWFNDRLRKHITDVRTLISPDVSDKQRAALIARRTGAVGPLALA